MIRALVLVLLAASGAHAQSIEEARTLYDSARFVDAIDAYGRALDADALTRDDVMTVLRGRALANLAASRESAADRDIRALLSLDPDATLGDEAPPAVQQHVDELRAGARSPLTVTGTAIPTSERWTVQVIVRGDVGRLVQRLAVFRRSQGAFEPMDTERRRVEYPPSSTLTYYIVAYGPGDAVLATHGSAESPIEVDGGMEPTVEPPPIEDPPIENPVEDPPPPRDRRNLWIGLGAGGAALLVILIAVGVSAGGSNVTQPSAPVEVE